jgi:DNA-binding Xre family transcriptional regulator
MTKTVSYHWHVRKLMAEHGMHSTTALVPLLADRGVVMTPTQVYRIVTRPPERMNMQMLSALCDIFGCTPNDLIEPFVVATSSRRRKAVNAPSAGTGAARAGRNRPTRVVLTDPSHDER